jgi:hypothetical protein
MFGLWTNKFYAFSLFSMLDEISLKFETVVILE